MAMCLFYHISNCMSIECPPEASLRRLGLNYSQIKFHLYYPFGAFVYSLFGYYAAFDSFDNGWHLHGVIRAAKQVVSGYNSLNGGALSVGIFGYG